MKLLMLVPVGALFLLSACTMFTSWRAIPAPGGCEECHKVPISANWQVTIKPVTLTDERNMNAFQSPESLLRPTSRPASSLEQQKVEEAACFDCHNSPNASHKAVKGKFHH